MFTIPLQPVPSQQFSITLANQACQINVYQKFFGVFLDLLVSNTLIIGGVLCENLNLIVRDTYLGFAGDLLFFDNSGLTDPTASGLGARYTLIYLTVTDLQQADAGIVPPSAGILTGVPPVPKAPSGGGGGGGGGEGGGGGGGGGGGNQFGAPTQFNPDGSIANWSSAIVAQFNGYASGSYVMLQGVGRNNSAHKFLSSMGNNRNYPIFNFKGPGNYSVSSGWLDFGGTR